MTGPAVEEPGTKGVAFKVDSLFKISKERHRRNAAIEDSGTRKRVSLAFKVGSLFIQGWLSVFDPRKGARKGAVETQPLRTPAQKKKAWHNIQGWLSVLDPIKGAVFISHSSLLIPIRFST